MAAVAAPATPQRPLPGGYIQTPAPAPTIFAQQAASLRQNPQAPATTDRNAAQPAAQGISAVQRAARTINDTLAAEQRFPDLESYVSQGMSGEYDVPTNPAWLPFQKLKLHDLPPAIIQQANQASSALQLGVFPALGHCWAIMDSSLYLWDYTIPNPDLIGFEENSHSISAVKLVTPKPGVFVKEITHLIVVATTDNMLLLGVATQTTSTGAQTIALYNTKMSILTRGLNVREIEASRKTGRIFFLGSEAEDIFEFQYQQEEGWFRGKCARICHTRSNYDFVPAPVKTVGQWLGPQQRQKKLVRLTLDDTRDLLYTLSHTSELKIWTVKEQIKQALSRPMQSLLQNTGHYTGRTDLLYGQDVALIAIDAIPATEAGKLSLMATTNTGCRLYLSATRGYGFQADASNAPNSMQILHIRFPPRERTTTATPAQPGQTAMAPYGGPAGNVDTSSRMLKPTDSAERIPPGYFLAFQPEFRASGRKHRVFCAAPDFARLKNSQDTSSLHSRFAEYGQWIDLPSYNAGASLITPDFAATNTPLGFGNELAVQFDKTSAEIAIMTGAGVQTIRRRRLVDVFATLMRYTSTDDEVPKGDLSKFVNTYGRGETAATALAVACGQGLDVPQDSGRITTVTDPDVIEGARKAFIDYGGKPEYNANAVGGADPVDSVRPSPRHEGLALYISRLVRSIWTTKIIKVEMKPGEPPKLVPTVKLEKLRGIQRDLNALSDFLNKNKSFIDGLAGPQALSRVSNRPDEIALQGEHRAMNSLVQLLGSIVEGISFVLVLFDEKIEEILAALSEDSRKKVRDLAFETLCVSAVGRDLAKELVKAIVNRNIVNGSNVDTVAEALRRRCGSFCSADDVVIFKAQEQVKRASEAGSQSETGRVLLNESQRLFQKVAGSLSMEHLHWAVEQYVGMSFYAGAIQLCLVVAQEKDRAKSALAWLKDGMPESDSRKEAFDARKSCYDLVFATIEALDGETERAPQEIDGRYSLAAKRGSEAYDVIDTSDDAVFQTCLYDWYVSIGRADRLLDVETPYIIDYLKRRSQQERAHADLLWRYYAHHNDYLQAAATQLDLARGFFDLTLEERIQYLSRARTNASTRQTALMDTRQSKQQLLREISDLLDVANIQDDLLQRMKGEPRLTGERRQQVIDSLDRSGILPVDELFNQYTDQAGYHDLNLLIYQVADHRNPADIKASWEQLVSSTHDRAIAERSTAPWERVGEKVRDMGHKLNTADATFPIQTLLPLLERYAIGPQEYPPDSATWAVDVFLDLEILHETLLPVLEQIYYGNEYPFTGSKRKVIASHMVYLVQQWMKESERRGERVVCGSEENASLVVDCLASLLRGRDLDAATRREAEGLSHVIAQAV